MILVQNLLQQLSGNKGKLSVALASSLVLFSCSVKQPTVLKSPDYSGKTEQPSDKDRDEEKEKEVSENAVEKYAGKNIALLLPFQLNKVASDQIEEEDVKRSAMALDFYQGFQLGLEEAAGKKDNFQLRVLDSEDQEHTNAKLAISKDLEDAALVIGPVYPNEIKAFGNSSSNRSVLQVNPLAATMPREFGLPNLVSLTPSIEVHQHAMARLLHENQRLGDQIVVLNNNDSDSKQWLTRLTDMLRDDELEYREVNSANQLEDVLELSGINHIVLGTNNRFLVSTLIQNLNEWKEKGYEFRIYGHPMWSRFDFSSLDDVDGLQVTITSESHLPRNSMAKSRFDRKYEDTFLVRPSDNSYKGYDAGKYFGELLAKHGANYPDELLERSFKGLFSSYEFDYNPEWGFSNHSVVYKVFSRGEFTIQ